MGGERPIAEPALFTGVKRRAANIRSMKESVLRDEGSMKGPAVRRESAPPMQRGSSVRTVELQLVVPPPNPLAVAIVGINYAPEVTGIGVYTAGLARHLAQAGHDVVVHTGFAYYPMWCKDPGDRGRLFRELQDGTVRVRRCYQYVPARPSVLRRIAHELSFVVSSTLSYLASPRADVTIVVSPPLFLGIPVALAAWLRRSKVLFHVQDLQPDAAVELGMMRKGPVTRMLYALERLTYRLCHKVSAISPGMLSRIAGKGLPDDKLMLFRNWADVSVTPRPTETMYRREWGLQDRFVVLYSGNLGVKQGLEVLLDAAELLRSRADVAFVIVGDGGEKASLVAEAARRGLDNLMFKPLQPVEQLPELLATADVAVVPQRRAVSDIVLPSKVGNILGSGRPVIVAADPGTDLHQLVVDGDCGIAVPPGDGRAIADAVLTLSGDPTLLRRLGGKARQVAEKQLCANAILCQFEGWLRNWGRTRAGGAAPVPGSPDLRPAVPIRNDAVAPIAVPSSERVVSSR
jgi:colanic acid biosynthesis glycosyl transferase WcaI